MFAAQCLSSKRRKIRSTTFKMDFFPSQPRIRFVKFRFHFDDFHAKLRIFIAKNVLILLLSIVGCALFTNIHVFQFFSHFYTDHRCEIELINFISSYWPSGAFIHSFEFHHSGT